MNKLEKFNKEKKLMIKKLNLKMFLKQEIEKCKKYNADKNVIKNWRKNRFNMLLCVI